LKRLKVTLLGGCEATYPSIEEVVKQQILQCTEDNAPRRLQSNQSFNALKTGAKPPILQCIIIRPHSKEVA
jgi:hypothetical protein